MKDQKFDDTIPTIDNPPGQPDRKAALRARDAARKRRERAVTNPAPISSYWEKAEREFALADPDTWQALAIRDLEVLDTETELSAAMKAFDLGLPLSDFIDVNPDQLYQEIKADVAKHGCLNWREVEAMRDNTEGYVDFRQTKCDGSPVGLYRCYGLRTVLNSDTLPNARGLAICWFLTSGLDGENPVIEDAIQHLDHAWGGGHYSKMARKLIDQKNGIAERSELCTQVPISESIPKPISQIDRIIALKKASAEQYDAWIREATRGARDEN